MDSMKYEALRPSVVATRGVVLERTARLGAHVGSVLTLLGAGYAGTKLALRGFGGRARAAVGKGLDRFIDELVAVE